MDSEAMCSVPVSYLMHLQGRGDGAQERGYVQRMDSPQARDAFAAIESGVTPASYVQMREERDAFANQIAEFEFRAGCKLEHIPVEALGQAQDAFVSQQAIDTLKKENERLAKQLNALGQTESTKPAEAPYGLKLDGTPKKKPGGRPRKVRGKRAA